MCVRLHQFIKHCHTHLSGTWPDCVCYARHPTDGRHARTHDHRCNNAKTTPTGGFLAFTHDPLGTIARAYHAHGDCFTLRMFHKKITFLVGPEAHLTFFKAVGKDYDVELDQASCYGFMTPIFGKGVV